MERSWPGRDQKRFEQGPLARCELDRLAVPANAACREIDVECAVSDDRVRVASVAPPDRADPGRQFGEVERLNEVVVRTGVQPLDPVRDLVERGQDDDRRHITAGTQGPEKSDPPAIRQHEIEQDQIIGSALSSHHLPHRGE